MSEDSKKTPYLYTHYSDFFRRIMEREIYETAPERESQFKKPYLYDEHPRSEREFMPPGNPPLGPEPPWGPIGNDCQPEGGAVGGGQEFCKPGQECGKWFWTCAHKITSFTAVGGTIEGVEYGADDTVLVTACWNKVDATFIMLARTGTAIIEAGVFVGCIGDDPDPACTNCDACIDGGVFPTITYTTQQMSVSDTQTIYVDGGGGGPYHWSIISGGGTLNKTITNAGEGVIYTAPATNASCANNPTIQAEDYCLQTITLKIAVNAYAGTEAAYKIKTGTHCVGPCQVPIGTTCMVCQTSSTAYKCAGGTGTSDYPSCTNDLSGQTGADCSGSVTCCDGGGGTQCPLLTCTQCQNLTGSGNCPAGDVGTTDTRSGAMVTGGCCPSALL